MIITDPTSPGYGSGSATSAANAKDTDDAFEKMLEGQTPKEILEEITSGGIAGVLKWKIKEWQKQFTEEVMGSMQLTAEQIAAMPVEQRMAVEKKIMQMVEERVRLAIQEEMKQKQGISAAFMDKDTMQGLYNALEMLG